ncbi:MAG: undecaprenyl-phosphate glucose phosphotransferase [Burkholderiaceae bacterium]
MERSVNKISSRLELSLRLIDVLAIEAASQLASHLHFGTSLGELSPIHAGMVYLCCALAFLLLPQMGLYTSWRGRPFLAMLGRIVVSWGLVLLIVLFFSFLIHHVGKISRLWVFYWYMNGIALLMLSRLLVYSALYFLRKKGWNIKRVVIVGYGQTGCEMHRRAVQQSWLGYEVKAVHTVSDDAAPLAVAGVQNIPVLEEIHDYVTTNHINEIWLTLPLSASDQLQKLQYLLRNTLVDIRWIPDTLSMEILSRTTVEFMGFPAVDLNRPISSGLGGIAKDLFDKVFSLTILILMAPLFLVIAICIKCSSPGPVFFRQPRHGLNGRPFNVYKFRSMKLHQEHGSVTQAVQNDPRVTRIGSFLRRTSLDELPQFFNVLIGDMSVVGPRPHALQHNDMYKDRVDLYMLRHRVKPGITGWAQIHGYRGETDTEEKMAKRVQFDLYYIRNWTLWMDIQIVVWTAFRGWTGKNAY